MPVTVLDSGTLRDPDPGISLAVGDRISLLAPAAGNSEPPRPEPGSQAGGHPADAPRAVQAPRPEEDRD